METELSTTGLIIIIGVAVIVIVAIAAFIYLRKRRTERLRSQFGAAEYARTVQESGTQRRAEEELEKRKERVAALHIRPLPPGDRDRFIDLWRGVQARFVDTPGGAVTEANQLVRDVMAARGYPVTDFEQRAENISVDHPLVVENYRAAHEIAVRQARGQASTEDLRQAMVHYRTLFDELLRETEMSREKFAA